VLDQDLENLDSPREAFIVGKAWQRLIIDFATTRPGFSFELHMFDGQPPFERMQALAIRYGTYETRLARADPERANSQLTLFQDLGVALGPVGDRARVAM